MINNGIKQPLRFYTSTAFHNYLRCWNHSGFQDVQVVINPVNTIIPFQIRRKTSYRVITLFDLYTWDDASNSFVWDADLMALTPGVFTDHMKIIQTQQADNIVWNPLSSFLADLTCGLHYVTISDGVSSWYSEIFRVVAGFNSSRVTGISILPPSAQIQQTSAIAWTDGIDHYEIIFSSKP